LLFLNIFFLFFFFFLSCPLFAMLDLISPFLQLVAARRLLTSIFIAAEKPALNDGFESDGCLEIDDIVWKYAGAMLPTLASFALQVVEEDFAEAWDLPGVTSARKLRDFAPVYHDRVQRTTIEKRLRAAFVTPAAVQNADSVDVGHECAGLHETLKVVSIITLLIHAMQQVLLDNTMAYVINKKKNWQANIGKFLNLLDLLRTNILLQIRIIPIKKFKDLILSKTYCLQTLTNRGQIFIQLGEWFQALAA